MQHVCPIVRVCWDVRILEGYGLSKRFVRTTTQNQSSESGPGPFHYVFDNLLYISSFLAGRDFYGEILSDIKWWILRTHKSLLESDFSV